MQVGLAVLHGARVQVHHHDVLGAHLVEGQALALDQDGVAPGHPGAHVPQGQVRVALGGEHAAGVGHLLAQALHVDQGRGGGSQAAVRHQARSVGG